MNFIWDIVLGAEEQGIDKSDLFFCQAESCSPWYEQSFSSLNQKEITDKTIEINALCRFSAIFQGILHPEMKIMPEFRKYLFDLAMHLLCEIDLYQGITKQEFYVRRLSQEIVSGAFGKECARDYAPLPVPLKNQLSVLLLSQLRTGASLYMFRKAVLVICPEAMLYQLKEEREQLLLYLGRKKTKQYEHRVQFVTNTFLPIHYQIRIFWEHHFGVLEVDATMQLDVMEIF